MNIRAKEVDAALRGGESATVHYALTVLGDAVLDAEGNPTAALDVSETGIALAIDRIVSEIDRGRHRLLRQKALEVDG